MNRKGQMFIVTMVFMTGLIFAVQQILYQYSFIDPSDPIQRNDGPIFRMIEDSYNASIAGLGCSQANSSVQQLHRILTDGSIGPYDLELRYNGLAAPDITCGSNRPALTLSVHLTGPVTDSTAVYKFIG